MLMKFQEEEYNTVTEGIAWFSLLYPCCTKQNLNLLLS